MQNIDTLIHARWVIPIVPENVIHENYALAISGDKIIALLPSAEAEKKYQAAKSYQFLNHVLMPGLINMHTHSPMTLFRGLADDLELMVWLQQYIWPSEKKWVSAEFCYDGTQLAILEMLRSGTTCFNDNYFFSESIGQAAIDLGMRAFLGACIIDFPSNYAQTPDEYISKAEDLFNSIKKEPLLSMSIAPHAPYSVSDATFLKIKKFVEKYNTNIHLHLHETAAEIDQSMQQYNKRPIQRMDDLGMLTPHTQCVHMTQIIDNDINLLQKRHSHVVHCPHSNLKLASGFCPTKHLFDAGINLTIGTDGAASNNDLDLWNEMMTASQLAKAVSKNPTALKSNEVLKMATINAAKALNVESKIGSLEIGKLADVITINLNSLNTQPIFNPISHLIYALNSRQVSDVWIAGKHLLNAGKFTQCDENAIVSKARDWAEKIRHSSAEVTTH